MCDKDKIDKFRLLYSKNASRLILFARKFVDNFTAQDIVQDVFVKMWDSEIDLLDTGADAYLFRMVYNACLDHIKHAQYETNYMEYCQQQLKAQELAFYESPINKLIHIENKEMVYKEISQLPDQCRKIFTMAYIKEYSHIEIAELLTISVRTVESQVYKALKKIRESLLSKNK